MIREIWEKIKANWYWLLLILGIFAIAYLLLNYRKAEKIAKTVKENAKE